MLLSGKVRPMTDTPVNRSAKTHDFKLLGFLSSEIIPHIIDEIMNISPYAAYVLPKRDGWSVGIIPYRNKIIPPVNPIATFSTL
jgi:hypothetical protein